VVRQLFPLAGGGYVADTPGWKSLALWDTEPEEIDGYFPELRERVMYCQFSDCTHIHEPGCAVLEAVEKGDVDSGALRVVFAAARGGRVTIYDFDFDDFWITMDTDH
jgi:ribosome small subunit-dependent GTPase A